MTGRIRPYQPGDERVVFRDEDEAECRAATGISCAASILEALSEAGTVDVGLDAATGEPFCFFGMAPASDIAGAVWMLATPVLARNALALQKHAPAVISKWHQQRPLLFNYVDSRNALHIKWLRRLGFVFIHLHAKAGVENRPFYEFVRLSHV